MNELSKEKTMTIKEVASILGKDESTIRKIAKVYFPELLKNGVTTYLNEKQVTTIKLSLGKNSELMKTSLEKELIIKQAMIYQDEKIYNLTKENERLNNKLIEQQPKADFYDNVTDSNDTIKMSEVAKIINIKGYGRNKIFELLRDKKVLDKKNQPYQQYVDRGYFRVIESEYETHSDIHIGRTTVVFQRGLEYIIKLIKKELY